MSIPKIGPVHRLNERSIKALAGVHPDLVRVVERAALLTDVPIVVTEGLRTAARQKELVSAGRSWTQNSRHLTGHAVDLVDGDNFGYDIPDMDKIAKAMKEAASECGVSIVWGGDWKSRDTPHFELDRSAYPASGVTVGTQVAEVAGKVVTARTTIAAAAAVGSVASTRAGGDLPAGSADPILQSIQAFEAVGAKLITLATPGNATIVLVGAAAYAVVTLVLPKLGIGK